MSTKQSLPEDIRETLKNAVVEIHEGATMGDILAAGYHLRDEEVGKLKQAWNCDKAANKEGWAKVEYYEKKCSEQAATIKELLEGLEKANNMLKFHVDFEATKQFDSLLNKHKPGIK